MSTATEATGIHVEELGAGEPILFVHGGLMDGSTAWSAQHPLASGHCLRFMDRYGYGQSADRADKVRLEADSEAIVGLIAGGSHVVGHSYGGLICLLAAVRAPVDVLSLTLIEPPAFALVRGDPYVEALIKRLSVALPTARRQGPQQAAKTFFDALGLVGTADSSASFERATRSTFREPYPWTIDPQESAQLAGRVPVLIVSGGWAGEPDGSARHDAGLAFQHVCARLAERLNGRHEIVEGAGHAAQFTGSAFNSLLASFVAACTPSR